MLYKINKISDNDINDCKEKIIKKNKKNNTITEQIFFCVIYNLYMIVYKIINDIYKNNIKIIPFLNKECCECKRNSGNTL